MIGRTNTGGGGGGGLNYKVVGGTTAPSNPKENTIWINTDVEITSHIFSTTEPEVPVAGMVWISIGTSSAVAFNVLKKNCVMIYPMAAKQYVDGAWVDKTAKSYQDGAWVDWVTYLFNDGDTCNDITGGWVTTGWQYYSSQTGLTTPTIGETISLYGSSSGTNKCGIAATSNKIDLTDVSTIYVHNVAATTGGNGLYVMSSKTYIQGNYVATKVLTAGNSGTDVALDVTSLTGSYYIVLCSNGSTTNTNPALEVSKVWLVK